MAIQYNSNYDGTLTFSDVCEQFGLVANVEQTFTIPGAETVNYQALFGYGNSTNNVFVQLNGTPTVPGGGSNTSQQYNELKPEKRFVKGGDVLHFITPDALAYCTVSLRQIA